MVAVRQNEPFRPLLQNYTTDRSEPGADENLKTQIQDAKSRH